MKIIRLEARAFGKLENFVLEPQGGLNRYCHPNEFGKTTLIHFIYYMFYGYNAKLLSGYLPWSGADLAGSLTFEQGGRSWRVERRRPARGAEKRQIICLTTGEELKLAAKEQPGPHFLKLDGETFLKTFCITQGDLLFARTDGLDVALKNMAATGDENVSYRQAEDWLNKQHTKYMYRGKNQGPLLDLTQKLAEDTHALGILHQQVTEQIGCTREWEDLERQIAESSKTIEGLKVRLKQAEASDALRLLERLNALKEQKPMDPPAVSKEMLTQLEQAFAAREQAEALSAKTAEEAERLAEQLQLIGENVGQFGFNALSGGELEKLQKKQGFPWWALLLGLAVGADGVAMFTKLPVLYGAAGILLVAAVALLAGKKIARQRICHRYGAADPRQLLEKWEKYQQTLGQQEEYKSAWKESCEQATAAKTAAETALSQLEGLRGKTRIFTPEELQQARIDWAVYENSLAKDPAAVQEQALLNGRSRQEVEQLAQGAVLQEETAARVRTLLEAAEEEHRALRNRRDAIDPYLLERLWKEQAELEEKNRRNTQTVQEMQAQLAAVQKSLAWLKDANEEMNTRFAPQLCGLAGEHLARLTGGKYHNLLLDMDFGISLETAEGTYPLAQFSAGTRDGVYFAFRLAVSELLSHTALPMVLDDPFVNLDPARRQAAEELLERAAEDRQILYFTCNP